MRLLFFLLSIICFTDNIGAKPTDSTKFVPLQRMSAYSWAGKNGIVSNNITCAIQSNSGYLWLTTYNGILRFDGYQTILFDRTKLNFLKNDGFRKVYEGPDDKLYFAGQGCGIVVYNDQTFRPLTVSNGEIPQSVSSLVIEENGNIWIGSNNEGLFYKKEDSIYHVGPESLHSSTILDLAKDDDGSVWVGTEGEGLFRLKQDSTVEQFTINEGLSNNVINFLTFKDGVLYIGTQSGICRYQNDQLEPLEFLKDQSINFILPDHHKIWVGTYNGLGRLDFQTGKQEFISAHKASDLTRINWLSFDQEGSLWIATGRDGLIQMRVTGITNYTTFDGLSSNKVNIVSASDDQNSYFIGCDDGRIFKLQNENLSEVRFSKYNENIETSTGIRDIYEDQNGTLWIASYKGIIKKESNGKETHLGKEIGLPSLDIRRILKDKSGNFWLGSRSGGLSKMINNKVVQVYDKQHDLKSNFILCVEEDKNGNILVGTHSGGLSIISPDGKITNFNITDDDAGIIIFNLHIDAAGNIWVVTNMGLYHFKNGIFKKLTLKNDYPGTSMFDWLEDNSGNAWITTTQGIININHNELKRFLERPFYPIESRIINKTDGMIEKECTSAVHSLKASNGQLFIPTINGVSVIDPNAIKKISIKPKVYVNKLITDNEEFLKSGIEIGPGNIRYTINFTALSFVSPEKVLIRYKLDNFDEDYRQTTDTRQIEYTNLAPGDYTFHVMAANKDGVWNSEEATFSFTVSPHFYQSAWFYLIIIILSGLILYGLYKWRVYGIEQMNLKLRKVNGELDSFVYSASHDLRSPLASLLGLIELTRRDPGNVELYLDKMQSSVKKLDTFIGDIIDFSSNDRKEIQISTIKFSSLIENILAELDYMDIDDKIKVNIDVKSRGRFQNDKRRVAIILRNLISNALKYSDLNKEQPTVDILVEHNTIHAEIVVKDNGIGIDRKDIKDIFNMFYRATEFSSGSGLGLYIVKETVEKLQGNITIESSLNVGSTFKVLLPNLPLET